MIVIISDLHFKEEASEQVGDDATGIRLQHNLPPSLFARFFEDLAGEAVANKANKIDLVLAGDIFELLRSGLWLNAPLDDGKPVRPYLKNDDILPDSPVEAVALRILDAIAADESAGASLGVIRKAADIIHSNPQAAQLPVSLVYLPGNHDRLANATPALRRRVRELLGLPKAADDELFQHVFHAQDESAFVRHGHEYDRFNFGHDLSDQKEIDSQIDPAWYGEATFGDFVTIDIAARLPWQYRKHHGEKAILHGPEIHRDIYLHLLQFDDLRPQSALLDYLLAIPGYEEKDVWSVLEPVAVDVLMDIRDDPFLHGWLDRLESRPLDLFDLAQIILKWDTLKAGVPLWLAKKMAKALAGSGSSDEPCGPALCAARERLITQDVVRFLVAGHTHSPAMQLLRCGRDRGSYYLDTGTWRNRVLSSPNRSYFETVKSMTYICLYGPDEDLAKGSDGEGKLQSVDMWTGFTRRWMRDEADRGEILNQKGGNLP